MTLDELNRIPEPEARLELERCCGAVAWVARMCAARPYASVEELHIRAEQAAVLLGPDDWREAFAHHPRIGDVASLRARFPATAGWAASEQRGAAAASDEVLEALAEGNRAYEERFGYIFIVCATGRSADEMLALLRGRLDHSAAVEFGIAVGEQMKITRLRLEKLIGAGDAPGEAGKA
jgi:2-oxo-4-hydroxy-4-carboxy-5-ureidoimidazoline decarboxylase